MQLHTTPPASAKPMSAGPHSTQSGERPSVSRRTALTWAGLGAGAAVLTTGAALTWRASDQGVFSTGAGPAYQAWRDWRMRAGDPASLLKPAVLAANAHNTQPWTFAAGRDRIDLFVDTTRSMGTLDALAREQQLSLGCALENLTLAARAAGFAPAVALLPTAGDRTHVARMTLTPAPVETSPLYEAIPRRHTNRAKYDVSRPIDAAVLHAMVALSDTPSARLIWLTDADAKRRFGALTVAATRAIIDDPEQAADDFLWYRQDWNSIQRRKDGITLDAAGLGSLQRTLAKILPHQLRGMMQKGWLTATRDRHVPSAAAFGLLVVPDRGDTVHRLQAGRFYQRLQLAATIQGLAMQPLAQTTERADREAAEGLAPTFTEALAGFLPERGWQVVLPFRIGYPTAPANLSPRRPAAEVGA
jgi:hypothetical protein